MSGAEGLTEKQGYLGNLEKKPRSELQDLLNRQDRLLNNTRFVSKLPDKGKRIKELAERLRSLLSLHEDVDGTADMLQNMALDAEQKYRSRAAVPTKDEEDSDADILREIVNRDNHDKVIEDNRTTAKMETDQRTFINSYEKVIRNVEAQQVEKGEVTDKFKPNRSIKTQHIQDVSEDKLLKLRQTSQKEPTLDPSTGGKTKQQNTAPGPQKRTKIQSKPQFKTAHFAHKKLSTAPRTADIEDSRLKYRYDDSLELDMQRGPLHHQPARLITVDESIKVLEQQQKHHKELQAHQAAAKLSERLNMKIGNFNPEGAPASSTIYREPVHVTDSDQSEGEEDYPD